VKIITVRTESTAIAGEWGSRGPRNLGFETIIVRDHRQDDGRGEVIVWAESGRVSTAVERFGYGNAKDYGNEREARDVHLSALGNACAVAQHVANNGTLYHIPQEIGGWGDKPKETPNYANA
jgi:hypothetical protein